MVQLKILNEVPYGKLMKVYTLILKILETILIQLIQKLIGLKDRKAIAGDYGAQILTGYWSISFRKVQLT